MFSSFFRFEVHILEAAPRSRRAWSLYLRTLPTLLTLPRRRCPRDLRASATSAASAESPVASVPLCRVDLPLFRVLFRQEARRFVPGVPLRWLAKSAKAKAHGVVSLAVLTTS